MSDRVPSVAYAILFGLGLIWGSSFILIKKGLLVFTPMEIAALRIFTAGIVMLPIMIKWFPKAKRSNLKWFVFSGLVGSALPAFLFAFAQTKLSSSVTGALNALTPLFAVLVGVGIFKLQVGLMKWLGVLVGLAGALMLILLKPAGQPMSGDLINALGVILAASFYGININIIKEKFHESRPMVIAAFPTAFMMFPAAIILFSNGFFTKYEWTGDALNGLIYISILGVVGTALALVAFNRLVLMTNAVFSSFTTYFIPVVALGWGLLDGETVSAFQLIGLGLILVGVLLVNRKRKPRTDQ